MKVRVVAHLVVVHPVSGQVERLHHMRTICMLAVIEGNHLNGANNAFIFVIALLTLEVLQILALVIFAGLSRLKSKSYRSSKDR